MKLYQKSTLDSSILFFGEEIVVIQYHGSMLQGDILFLHMNNNPIRAGEIVVFNVDVSKLS